MDSLMYLSCWQSLLLEQGFLNKPCMKVVKMNEISYGLVTMSVLITVWTALSGFAVIALQYIDELSAWVPAFNVVPTSLFIPIFLFRVVWNFLLAQDNYKASRIEAKLARFVHTLLYVVTSGVVSSVLLVMNKSVFLADFKIMPYLVSDPLIHQLFKIIHFVFNLILVGLVTLHAGTVTKHQLSENNILNKMLSPRLQEVFIGCRNVSQKNSRQKYIRSNTHA